jgi:hypothetical protein
MVALLLSAGGLPPFNSRAPTAGAFVGHRSAARSSLSQSVVSSRLPPCVPLRRSPARLLRLVGLEGVRRPEARLSRGPPPTPKDHSGTRTPTDLIPPSRKRGGRSFGAALSEVAMERTPTSSAGLATGQAMSRSPSGDRRFRGWRQRFGARVMPYVGSDRWWLNRLAPLRCLSARYTRPRTNARGPLRPSPPTAPSLAVRSDPSQAIRNCLAGHA